jgi:hypothetical protein
MITAPVTPAVPTAPHPLPRVAAGVALLAFPPLLAAGLWASPEQASDSPRDYVASLGVDPAQTALSAGLLHYAWVAFALGVLGAVGLVRGRRGRVAVPVVAVLAAFSALQLSGLLVFDFFNAALARALPIDRATEIFTTATADPWLATWLVSGRVVGFVGVPVVVAALARAGVVSWWLLLAPVLGFAVFFLPFPALFVLGNLVGAAPMAVVGARLLTRASARVRAQER